MYAKPSGSWVIKSRRFSASYPNVDDVTFSVGLSDAVPIGIVAVHENSAVGHADFDELAHLAVVELGSVERSVGLAFGLDDGGTVTLTVVLIGGDVTLAVLRGLQAIQVVINISNVPVGTGDPPVLFFEQISNVVVLERCDGRESTVKPVGPGGHTVRAIVLELGLVTLHRQRKGFGCC